jgi:hypothetical protein
MIYLYIIKLNNMKNQIRIAELNNKLNSLNYNENGMPIGVDANEYVALIEELEELESK